MRHRFEPDESMNSRVSWSAEGIDPSVRERAEAAARRAGMSLNDWLNSTVGGSAPPDFRGLPDPAHPPLQRQETKEVADIHQRLDSITRQIEQISKPGPRTDVPREAPGVARQLNDAIARLDARLSQISSPGQNKSQRQNGQTQPEPVQRAAAEVYRSPPSNPGTLEAAIAEIAARQSELDDRAPRPMAPRNAPPVAPSGPDFGGLERHLLTIIGQIESLQRPDVEQSIAAFRNELNEIRQAITEAMPRRAIESIENEIRSLSRRIDESRENALDSHVLANIEGALNEIHATLRALTPAEQLAGYDEAIRNLSAKLDLIVRSSDDSGTIHQLEDAIAALRSIVSNVASTDALTRLSEDVHTLSAKVDQLARWEGKGDSFAVLEQRLAALTSSLESRERPVLNDNSEHLEGALRALMDRLDHMQVGNDSASTLAHLEQRVSYLLERLEATTDHRSGNLGRVEQGLQEVLRHLEAQHASLAAFADNSRNMAPLQAAQMDSGLVDLIKRELSDMRFGQTETERRTQDSLEVVHNTLGHVVDRLAMIEGDLRAARAAPVPPPAPVPAPQPVPSPRAAPPRPELPNPAAAQPHFSAAPRDFHAAEPAAALLATPRAISEILEPQGSPRPAVVPDLPPDHPLEPGTRPPGRTASSPSERIAASESALSEISPATREQPSTSSFIAAARRAAQAAAAQPKDGKAKRPAPLKDAANDAAKGSSNITSKIRSLLVGASVVVIVLGTFKMGMTLLDNATQQAPAPETEISSEPPAAAPADNAKPAPAPALPSMTSPTPIGRQSFNAPAPGAPESASAPIPQVTPPPTPPTPPADITGTIPQPEPAAATAPMSGRKLTTIQIPAGEQLPEAIGGAVLRNAALKGDPAAAYEVGVRYAEGKGVPASYDDAAKWYERAAQAGLVPAIFRLGTLYEKGLSVKKDVDIARRYYLQAAERGNAKAMHNLAVLDADGGGKGANYKSAAQWFRKAADRGVPDSQFNLGILYARGIGVEQNLAESFKWFSLAASQGDADAVRKRDDVAKRLDAQSLAAAKLAIQTFTPESQPDDAVNVASPAGGWDAAAQAGAAKSAPAAAKPAAIKRASR